jgi:hypothetical protein
MVYLKILFVVLVVTLSILSGCSSDEMDQLLKERDQYKKRIEVLERVNKQLLQKVETAQKEDSTEKSLSLNYIDNSDQRRFIARDLPLLILPKEGSGELNLIEANTVIEVEDFVEVNHEVWIYVTIPVFDAPMNMKGWVKEIDTEVYTKEIMQQVKSPIVVEEGTSVFKVDFGQIQSATPTKAEQKYNCFVSDEQDGYLALGCAGGGSFIVKKEEAIYPSVEKSKD